MSKHAGGRPRKYTDEEIQGIYDKPTEYIDATTIPILNEFAYMNDLVRQSLYDYPELSTLLKRCSQKKQANLEKAALANKVNVPMAIFSLKQMGWSDRQEIKHEVDTTTEKARRKRIEELEAKTKLLE